MRIINSKRGTFSKYWVEYLFLFLLVIGFIVSATSGSAVLTYIIIILMGMIVGRFWFQIKKHIKAPYFFVV